MSGRSVSHNLNVEIIHKKLNFSSVNQIAHRSEKIECNLTTMVMMIQPSWTKDLCYSTRMAQRFSVVAQAPKLKLVSKVKYISKS